MRTIHILLLALAILPDAIAQQSIAMSNARWTVSEYSGPDLNDGIHIRTSESGYDTIIDGMVHSKLFGAYDNVPFGALRDNMLGQVFYRRFQDNSEHLLYDFDVSVGDTVHVYNEPYQAGPIVVFGVDTIIVAGIERKRIDTGSSDAYWIEGIGGTQGLLTTCACITVSTWYRLDCMSVDAVRQYPVELSGEPGHCFSPTGISDTDPLIQLHIYPNPSQGGFTIEHMEGSPIAWVELFDAQGRAIPITWRTVADGRVLCESSDLVRSGIYVVRTVTAHGRSSKGTVHIQP